MGNHNNNKLLYKEQRNMATGNPGNGHCEKEDRQKEPNDTFAQITVLLLLLLLGGLHFLLLFCISSSYPQTPPTQFILLIIPWLEYGD